MPFPAAIRLEALIACQRQCCLCNERKHTRMQCHHIVQEADGGPDTFDNCIPLCPDCHAEVQAFNPRHPFGGTPYHPSELKRRRDDWYAAVAGRAQALATDLHRSPLKYPKSEGLRGQVKFNYTHHDGFYRLGKGNYEFLTHWSRASDQSIHCYSDRTNVSIALARKGAVLTDITQASLLHYGSRVQTPLLNQIVVFENHLARYAAIKVVKLQDGSRQDDEDLAVFDYWILEDGTEDFSNAT